MLEWSYSNPVFHHQNVSIDVVPHLTPTVITSTSLQLTLSYNTRYNISAVPIPCDNNNEAVYLELIYSKAPLLVNDGIPKYVFILIVRVLFFKMKAYTR